MDYLNISICLSDIPEDKIRTAGNGKKYINITAAKKKEADQYDNTHSIYVSQTADERKEKVQKEYLGSGREFNYIK